MLAEATAPLVGSVESSAKAAAKAAGYQCQITIVNNCPPSWGVVIVSAGVKFFYRDGTDYTDGPRNINLGSGGTATFVSNDASKCVYQYFLAMVVQVPNQGSQTFTDQGGVEEGKCLIHTSVTLGPKESVAAAQLSTVKLTDLLQITKA